MCVYSAEAIGFVLMGLCDPVLSCLEGVT